MKIFISLIQMRDSGGITPSTLNLLNEISVRHEVTLCILSYKSKNKQVPANIKFVKGSSWMRDCLTPRDMLKEQTTFQRLRRTYRRILKRIFGVQYVINKGVTELESNIQYDVAIAYANNIYKKDKLILGGDYDVVKRSIHAKRKIAWIHNDPYKCGFTHARCQQMFNEFDAIVCVSKDNQRLLNTLYPEGISKSYTVYNMYHIERIKHLATEGASPYNSDIPLHFVTVARIDNHQKRIDRIVKVCKRLQEEGYTNFDWTIVGEGGDSEAMCNLSNQLGIRNLYFVGLKTNPYPYIYHASASVLTSDYEGYSMTVKESQILGIPTIITNYDAAKEAVTNGCEGIICDKSTKGVHKAIKAILDNPELLQSFRNYLKNNPVSNNIALAQFDEVIKLKTGTDFKRQ